MQLPASGRHYQTMQNGPAFAGPLLLHAGRAWPGATSLTRRGQQAGPGAAPRPRRSGSPGLLLGQFGQHRRVKRRLLSSRPIRAATLASALLPLVPSTCPARLRWLAASSSRSTPRATACQRPLTSSASTCSNSHGSCRASPRRKWTLDTSTGFSLRVRASSMMSNAGSGSAVRPAAVPVQTAGPFPSTRPPGPRRSDAANPAAHPRQRGCR